MSSKEHNSVSKRSSRVKKSWSNLEDKVLTECIEQHYGPHPKAEIINWQKIAKAANIKRTTKQVRERWVNKLDPNLRHDEFDEEETTLLKDLQAHHGNKWTFIAKHMPGRSEGAIKNYWYSQLASRRKQKAQKRSNAPLVTPLSQESGHFMARRSSHVGASSSSSIGQQILPIATSVPEEFVADTAMVPADILTEVAVAAYEEGKKAKAQNLGSGHQSAVNVLSPTNTATSDNLVDGPVGQVRSSRSVISPCHFPENLDNVNKPLERQEQHTVLPIDCSSILRPPSEALPSLGAAPLEEFGALSASMSPFRATPWTPGHEFEASSPVASLAGESVSSRSTPQLRSHPQNTDSSQR